MILYHYTIQTLLVSFFFFFNDTATTEIYTLSLHDALPILYGGGVRDHAVEVEQDGIVFVAGDGTLALDKYDRSEEHTSELQSRSDLVCRLLLEKKKQSYIPSSSRLFRSY